MPNKRGGQNKRGVEIFVKFNKQGEVEISKYWLISVMNEKKRQMSNIDAQS